MSAQHELTHLWSLNLSGFQACAGYLNCIFKRLQLERPLSEDEIEQAHDETGKRIIDLYGITQDLMEKHNRFNQPDSPF